MSVVDILEWEIQDLERLATRLVEASRRVGRAPPADVVGFVPVGAGVGLLVAGDGRAYVYDADGHAERVTLTESGRGELGLRRRDGTRERLERAEPFARR